MNTVLFTWNPEKWQWTNISEAVVEANQTGKYYDDWSCGVSKYIKPGDRAFLVKLGQRPKGIIGSGYVVSDVFIAPHWDLDLAKLGKTANKVNIEFDVLSETPIITEDDLKTELLSEQTWFPQSSGITIDESIVKELEVIWQNKTKSNRIEEIQKLSRNYSEGKRVVREAYSYERNSEAREKCLSIYGYKCFICGFDFYEVFGELGEKFIHVHHRKPVSEIGNEYFVDPEKDLVPVCPNCHAMIHRKVPAIDVNDLKNLIKKRHYG